MHDLKGGAPFFGFVSSLLFDFGHEHEFLGIGKRDIHAKTRHLDDERLRHGDGFEVRGGISPGNNDLLALQIAAFFLHDGHQVSQALEGMINITLHIQDRHAAVPGNFIEVGIANAPVAVADGDAVKIAAVDLADFFGGIAVGNLGGLAFDESAVPTELSHASFERAAGARAAEEEQHCQHFIAQIGVGFIERALALEVPGDVQNGFDFLF